MGICHGDLAVELASADHCSGTLAPGPALTHTSASGTRGPRMDTVTLTVNGEAREVPVGTTVAGLLEMLGVGTGAVAVEINAQVVRRAQHPERTLAPGDQVEIVTFVGGG